MWGYPHIFIYTFLSNSPTGWTAHHIFMLDDSNSANTRKGVRFLAFVNTAAY